jgi:predicted TPR repeat methyltransferase
MTNLRTTLSRFPLARSSYCLGLRLNKILRDSWAEPASFNQLYSERNDPWCYSTSDEERRRYELAANMLDKVAAGAQFDSALEIGCGEGIFTSDFLAPKCRNLLATDFSSVALARAQARISATHTHVETRIWKLRDDPAPPPVDLVVSMDVIDSMTKPGDIRRACAKIIQCVKPGGYLLVTVTSSPGYDDFWWSKLLLAGGKHIIALLKQNPGLQLVDIVATPFHLIALLRKSN